MGRIGSNLRSQKGLISSTMEGIRKLHRGSDAEFRMKMGLSDREEKEGENIPDGFKQGNTMINWCFRFISRFIF